MIGRLFPLSDPWWGRPVLTLTVLAGLSSAAVAAAPHASASTNAAVLGFTGLTDSYGVPIGDYYLAVASLPDQITRAGPAVTWNPGSWTAWTAHTAEVLLTNVTLTFVLTAEAGAFVGIVALALWVMKLTVSSYWLTVIGEIARAVAGAVIAVTTQLGLLVLAVPVGVLIGALTIRRGEAGRGATMILIAMTLPAASVAVFADPAGAMYGPDGLLAFGRRVGFSVAEAATHNGPLGAPGGSQVDTLTASLITHTVREPLQLWNFGHVVDRVGGCGSAWSAAVRGGAPDGPITAMAACGDRGAVAYAQHLDGTNEWIGLVFVAAALLLALFMVTSGWAVMKVSVNAVWTTVILLPTLWLGAIPGTPQRRAVDVVWQFFRHGVEVMVYIVYVSVIGLAMERVVTAPLPAELGGTSAFAHVLMMGAVSVAALLLGRHLRADLIGHPRGGGRLVGRATEVAVGMGIQAGLGGAGSAAAKGLRGRLGRLGGVRGAAPWDQLDRAADNAPGVHGDPAPGVDPVPNAPDDPGREHATETGSAASGLAPISDERLTASGSAEVRTQRDPSAFEEPVALVPITDAGGPPPADEDGPPEPTTVGPVDEPPDSPGAIAPR
jgi:hypothetical protein